MHSKARKSPTTATVDLSLNHTRTTHQLREVLLAGTFHTVFAFFEWEFVPVRNCFDYLPFETISHTFEHVCWARSAAAAANVLDSNQKTRAWKNENEISIFSISSASYILSRKPTRRSNLIDSNSNTYASVGENTRRRKCEEEATSGEEELTLCARAICGPMGNAGCVVQFFHRYTLIKHFQYGINRINLF